jgi:hypothetical protein
MPRIRLTEKGWAGFTGNMGTAVFMDGEADVSELEASRIGANIEVMRIDAEGEVIEQISPSLDIVRTKNLSAEVVAASPTSEMILITPTDGDDLIAAGLEALSAHLVPPAEGGATDPAADPGSPGEGTQGAEGAPAEGGEATSTAQTTYTREELEKIADEKGIKGLREIADPLGLKSNSIVPLIDSILEKQAS